MAALADSAPPPPRRLDAEAVSACRALVVVAAVGAPALWALDRLGGRVYDDPFELRLCVSAIATAVLVFSYANERFRMRLREVTNGYVTVSALFYGWTAAKNGVDAAGSAGLLLVALVGGLSMAYVARRAEELAWPLVALGASILVPVLVVDPPPGGYGYGPVQLAGALTLGLGFVYVLGVGRLRTMRGIEANRRELVAANAELAAVNEATEAATKANGEFLRRVSRDVRASLDEISRMADRLIDSDLDASQEDAVRSVRTSARTLSALVSDPLEVDPLEVDASEVEDVPFEPSRLALEVETTPGVGTTFTLDVEAEPVDDRRLERVVAALERRVLVVEDNPVNQKVVCRLLDRLGFAPDVAEDGALGLAALHDANDGGRPYDVVVMDIMMPVMDGLEATRRLRAELPQEAQPRVIALTANAMVGNKASCLAAGADAYLTKPVRREDLERETAAVPLPVPAAA